MAVVMNFAIFPIDKGTHIGEYVSKVVAYIKESGVKYQFTPMGTIIETSTVKEALAIIEKAYEIIDPISDRVYCVMNMDQNKNKDSMLEEKTRSVEKRIGEVDKS